MLGFMFVEFMLGSQPGCRPRALSTPNLLHNINICSILIAFVYVNILSTNSFYELFSDLNSCMSKVYKLQDTWNINNRCFS